MIADRKRWRGNIATVLVVGGVMALPYYLWMDWFSRDVIAARFNGRAGRVTAVWDSIDNGVSPVSRSGNVAVIFDGFTAENPLQRDFVESHYNRVAYTLYPQRIIAAEPGHVINDAYGVLSAHPDTSAASLREQGVRTIVTYRAHPDGTVLVNINPVSASGTVGQ